MGRREQSESNYVAFIQPSCRGINEIWSKMSQGLSVIKGRQISDGTRNLAKLWFG